MVIDLNRLLDRPPGGWPKEGRFIFGEDFKELQKIREIRQRATRRHLQPSSTLPPTWKDDFREEIFLSGRDLGAEEKNWLNAFLDHPGAENAFKKLLKAGSRWTDGIFLHIFIVCRPVSFRARELSPILEDKDRVQKNEKFAKSLAIYIEKVDKASVNAGEFFGTMSDVILSNLSKNGITIKDENENQNIIPKMLLIIGSSFWNHIRRTYRGPKFDHRTYWIVASLAMKFREQFDRPLIPVIASLLNATFPDHDGKEYTDVKEILDTVSRRAKTAGLEEFVLRLSPPKKKVKGANSAKKSKK